MPWPMKSLKSVGARKAPLGICVQLWVVKEGRVDGLGVVASFSIYTIKWIWVKNHDMCFSRGEICLEILQLPFYSFRIKCPQQNNCFYSFAFSATISPPFSPYMTLLATQNRKQVKCKLDIMILFVIIFTCLLSFYPQFDNDCISTFFSVHCGEHDSLARSSTAHILKRTSKRYNQ